MTRPRINPRAAIETLSDRQRDVLARLARRQSYKMIASDIGISQSRVNQHIRELKDLLDVNDPAGLVEVWLSTNEGTNCTKGSWRISQLPGEQSGGHQADKADAAVLTFRDAGTFVMPAPWESSEFERVGPGYLDGPGGSAKRIGFIVLVAFGFPMAVVATLSAMMALAEMLHSLQ